MPKRLLVAACAAILLSGCASDSVAPGIVMEGTFSLTSVSGEPLPAVVEEISDVSAVRRELLSGSIQFEADGSYTDVIELRYTQAGVMTTVTDSIEGTYRAVGTTITFTASAATYTAIHDLVADRFTTIAGGFALLYTRQATP
ncbi:MAG: hypothetical protein WEF86_02530 [Gemmatimonadota bacterium]